jgi:hypothetical protein
MSELTEITSIDTPPTEFHQPPKVDADKLNELQQHPLFFQLTLKQQDFLLRFVEFKGNGRRAAKAVFKAKDDKSADYQARKLLRRWQIRKLLALYGKFTFEGYLITRDEALHLISEKLRDGRLDTKAFVELMRFTSKLQGWEDRQNSTAMPESDDNDEGTDTDAFSDDDVNRMVQELERPRGSYGKEITKNKS